MTLQWSHVASDKLRLSESDGTHSISTGFSGSDGSTDDTDPETDCTAPLLPGDSSSIFYDEQQRPPSTKQEPNITLKQEVVALGVNSAPLIVAFLLQNSVILCSLFFVGHLGKNELAACSLATMSANLTGYSFYQGFTTALDTLCAQSWGSNRKHDLGVHLQRCVCMLMILTIPIGAIWVLSPQILSSIVPETEVALMAGQYLRVLLFGAPGYALFEAGKKFVQCQGIYHAGTSVLLILAPCHVLLTYFLTWHPTFSLGFMGAAISVVITNWLMPASLLLYVYFANGKEGWGGFSRSAFHNWMPMLRLALPGVLMIEAEFLAFELLTLFSAYFGTQALAAQAVLATLCSFLYQVPFAIGIASCMQVAHYVGGGRSANAKISAKAGLGVGTIFGMINCAVLLLAKNHIGWLFSNDAGVVDLVAKVVPILALFQIADVLASVSGGIIRGQGRQYISGYIQVFAYYAIAMPVSLSFAFVAGYRVPGLWIGVALALILVASVQMAVVAMTDWDKVLVEARIRLAHGQIGDHQRASTCEEVSTVC